MQMCSDDSECPGFPEFHLVKGEEDAYHQISQKKNETG